MNITTDDILDAMRTAGVAPQAAAVSMPGRLWKCSIGAHGYTVRVFERVPGGSLYIGVPRPGGGYDRFSLRHRNKEAAMRAASTLCTQLETAYYASSALLGPRRVAA